MLRAQYCFIFATAHEHGHVVGDVNHSFLYGGRDSKVVLIDSDSLSD